MVRGGERKRERGRGERVIFVTKQNSIPSNKTFDVRLRPDSGGHGGHPEGTAGARATRSIDSRAQQPRKSGGGGGGGEEQMEGEVGSERKEDSKLD